MRSRPAVLCFMTFLLLPLASGAQDPAAPEPIPYVHMATSMGDLYIEVYPQNAPQTVENFLRYVRDGFYDGTVFHRIVPGFVIQGGGFDAELRERETRAPIPNEADNGLPNARGTLSMARTMDPDSATSQFFVNLRDNRALNHMGKTSSRAWGYAVFGAVVRGMDVVDAIAAVPTGPAGRFPSDVPVEPVVIETARIIDALPGEEQAPGPTEEDAAGPAPAEATDSR